MKNLFILTLLSTLFLFSCGKDDDMDNIAVEPTLEEQLFGDWNLVSTEYQGITFTDCDWGELYTNFTDTYKRIELEFKGDGNVDITYICNDRTVKRHLEIKDSNLFTLYRDEFLFVNDSEFEIINNLKSTPNKLVLKLTKNYASTSSNITPIGIIYTLEKQ